MRHLLACDKNHTFPKLTLDGDAKRG